MAGRHQLPEEDSEGAGVGLGGSGGERCLLGPDFELSVGDCM